MLPNDGEQLRKMVLDAGVSTAQFGRLMKVARNTPYNWFNSATLPDKELLEAARVLRMSAGEYFPRLLGKVAQSLHSEPPGVAEPPAPFYGTNAQPALRECQQQLAHWQRIAYENLEKYTSLLTKYNELLIATQGRHGGGAAGAAVAHSLAAAE